MNLYKTIKIKLLNESFNKYKVNFNKLLKIDPNFEYELESRQGNETYRKIYNKFISSKSKIISLSIDEIDYIAYIYENSDKADIIEKVIYSGIK